MDAAIPDVTVTGHEYLIDQLTLPDPDDRHVLAAAIHAGADLIVTANLTDFPAEHLTAWGVEAVHPDTFVHSLHQADPDLVHAALTRIAAAWRNPTATITDVLDHLERDGLTTTVAALRRQP
jgi:hypothetical protein